MGQGRAQGRTGTAAKWLALLLCFACTEQAADRPVFDGPDRLPGFRAGGVQDIEGYDRAPSKRVQVPAEFDLGGWMNAQVTDLPQPSADADLTVHAMAALTADSNGTRGILQIGIGSQRLLPMAGDADGGHIGLVIAVDESGSMASAGKNRKLKLGLNQLLDALPEGIHFGVVGFAGHARTIWPVKPWQRAGDLSAAKLANNGIRAAGGTNMHAGLERALKMAESIDADLLHRHVILVTDGRPSRGLVEHANFDKLLSVRKRPVAVSTIGIGESFDVELLERLRKPGGGASWMLQSVGSLEWVLLDAYRTIGMPLTTSPIIEVELAAGWTVTDVPGMRWEDLSDGGVTRIAIRRPQARRTAPGVVDEGTTSAACAAAAAVAIAPADGGASTTGADAGGTADGGPPSDADPSSGDELVNFSEQLAVSRSAIVYLGIAATDARGRAQLQGAEIGTVLLPYTPQLTAIARDGDSQPAEVKLPLQVVRLQKVCDHGKHGLLAVSSPIAHRALGLLRVGQGIEQGLAAWQAAEAMLCGVTSPDAARVAKVEELRKAARTRVAAARAELSRHCAALGLAGCVDDTTKLGVCLAGTERQPGLVDAGLRLGALDLRMNPPKETDAP